MHSILVKQDVGYGLGVSRLQRPPTLTPSNHKLNYNYVDISTTDFSLPKGNKCVSTLDWIRVTLSKSRNNYYCLVSTLDHQLFGGDPADGHRWEEDIEDGLSNRSRCWRASTAPT
jgi:hypothetical protein